MQSSAVLCLLILPPLFSLFSLLPYMHAAMCSSKHDETDMFFFEPCVRAFSVEVSQFCQCVQKLCPSIYLSIHPSIHACNFIFPFNQNLCCLNDRSIDAGLYVVGCWMCLFVIRWRRLTNRQFISQQSMGQESKLTYPVRQRCQLMRICVDHHAYPSSVGGSFFFKDLDL